MTSKYIAFPDLREIISKHPAFEDNTTHLERLASSIGHKILFCPKFHCELNHVEGVFCDLKYFVRRNNDQDFTKFNDLIKNGFKNYQTKKLNIKLLYMLWNALEMYQNDATYQEVLEALFGAKSSGFVKNHKKKTKILTQI